MPVPKDVLWELEPPTAGKHFVLREYLKAWLPILGATNERLVFIDGFAGPGEYAGGEDGSPIIALKTAITHSAKESFRGVRFLFVEENARRAEHLRTLVDALQPQLPPTVKATVHPGAFADVVGLILETLRREGRSLAPTLLMVDPFGPKGVPLSVLADFLSGSKKEVLISYMAESIRRFQSTGEFEPHLDRLFGGTDWRILRGDGDALEALYLKRLKALGGTHVLRFGVKEGARHIYTLFFVTKHPLGCDKMKQAMWKAAPDGSFSYEPSRAGAQAIQLSLGFERESLEQTLYAAFVGRGHVSITALEEWVRGDGTLFHSGQLRGALKALERDGGLSVVDQLPGRRRFTYPQGTAIEMREGYGDIRRPD